MYKVPYELFGHYVKIGAKQADNNSSNPPEELKKILREVLIELHYIVITNHLINLS